MSSRKLTLLEISARARMKQQLLRSVGGAMPPRGPARRVGDTPLGGLGLGEADRHQRTQESREMRAAAAASFGEVGPHRMRRKWRQVPPLVSPPHGSHTNRGSLPRLSSPPYHVEHRHAIHIGTSMQPSGESKLGAGDFCLEGGDPRNLIQHAAHLEEDTQATEPDLDEHRENEEANKNRDDAAWADDDCDGQTQQQRRWWQQEQPSETSFKESAKENSDVVNERRTASTLPPPPEFKTTVEADDLSERRENLLPRQSAAQGSQTTMAKQRDSALYRGLCDLLIQPDDLDEVSQETVQAAEERLKNLRESLGFSAQDDAKKTRQTKTAEIEIEEEWEKSEQVEISYEVTE